MIGLKLKKKRFTLLYLEETEIYVQDLTGSCTFYDFQTSTQKIEKGKIHICSKSVIFEPANWDLPIYKFLFKHMTSKPKKYSDIKNERYGQASLTRLFDKGYTGNNDSIIFKMSRIIEISTSGPPSPYIIHDAGDKEISISPAYENIEKIVMKLNRLIDLNANSAMASDLQIEIDALIDTENKMKFNMSHLESLTEKPLVKNQIMVKRIVPLISLQGILYVTTRNIYFQTFHSVASKPVKIIHIDDVIKLFRRRFELKHIGLELFTSQKKSYFFAFDTQEERDEVFNSLLKRVRPDCLSEASMDRITEKWQREEISNYEYLKYLNEAADRTFSDLTQYPVYPWIIKDYESSKLNLDDPNIYRDLSKPIGALNPKRLAEFKARYQQMSTPKYLYGTHYSAPGYVIGYLVRMHPQYMLKLQSGKFDKPDRLFTSIKKDWMVKHIIHNLMSIKPMYLPYYIIQNVMNNHAIVKELIPEFYGEDDTFLLNTLKLDLGIRQNGKRVDVVKLPKWAKNSQEYLRINRLALESKYVSENLHNWIDLIFGCKQRGPQAVEADNVFHYLTYEGMVDLDKITDPIERNALKLQINEFGQTPKQLFKIPHPSRYVHKYNLLSSKSSSFSFKNVEESKVESPRNNSNNNNLTLTKRKSTIDQNEEIVSPNNYNENNIWEAKNLDKLAYSVFQKLHKSEISCIEELNNDRIMTASHDGFIKIFNIKQRNIVKSFKVCDLSLSSAACLKENELFALGGWDNNIYIYNLNYGNKIYSDQAHGDAVSSLVYDPNKSIIYSASWDCTLKKWQFRNGNIDKSSEDLVAENNCQITKINISKDGNLLGYGDEEGEVYIKDLRCEEIVCSFSLQTQKITAIEFINNNQFLVSGENAIKLFELAGNELMKFNSKEANGLIVDLKHEGNNFITATDKGNSTIYNLLQEKTMGSLFKEYKDYNELPNDEDLEFTCLRVLKYGDVMICGSKSGSLNIVSYQQ